MSNHETVNEPSAVSQMLATFRELTAAHKSEADMIMRENPEPGNPLRRFAAQCLDWYHEDLELMPVLATLTPHELLDRLHAHYDRRRLAMQAARARTTATLALLRRLAKS